MNSMKVIIKALENKVKGGTIPFRGKVLLCMIGLSTIFSGALIPRSAWSLDPAQREAFITSIPQGETFENDGSTYIWLPTLQAERTMHGKAKSTINANDGSASTDTARDEIVERKGLFTVYNRSFSQEPSIRAIEGRSGGVTAHPVVLNLRTKSVAVITGKMCLKLKELEDAQSMADSYGITLSFVNTRMSTACYEIPTDMNILTLREDLENDSGILRATLDMVDRIRHPH